MLVNPDAVANDPEGALLERTGTRHQLKAAETDKKTLNEVCFHSLQYCDKHLLSMKLVHKTTHKT